MVYYWLMDNIFLDSGADYDKIINSANNPDFQILAENNRYEIEKIIKFFSSGNSVLVVTGFMGTGKTEIVKNITAQIDKNSILLWANCYESTNLDDILLAFFEKFKHLAANGKINLPQAKFENFNQRINACFSSIEQNITVVINSFQALMSENVKPIEDFILYLANFPNIKVVLISRSFNLNELSNVHSEKVVLKALDEGMFQKLLLSNSIKIYGPVADELYKLTKGYYFYTVLAIKIMLNNNLSVIDFIKNQSNSFMSMKEFLFQEILKIVGTSNPHLIRFLTVIRCPVNTKLLNALQLYDENYLKKLSENEIIETDHGNIYLKDYYKDMSGAEIPQIILTKIHKSCISLYELQLPRKPEERDLLISRKTIRQEIEYHRIFVPKHYEAGSKSLEIYNSQPILVNQKPDVEKNTKEVRTDLPKDVEPKELKDILFVFNEDEEKTLLTGIEQSINDFMANVKLQDAAENKMSEVELISLMNEAEDNFDYKRVISLGKKILLKNDVNKDIKIYAAEKTSICYEKLSDIYNAIKYCEITKNLLSDSGNTHKVLECEYNIARLNYKIFKLDYAKGILLTLIKAQNPSIKMKSELLLFDIYLDEGNEEKAFESCKEALSILDKNPEVLTGELLFKCGLILEMRKNFNKAIDAYERSLKVMPSETSNKYFIQTLNNLSNLYFETSNPDKALEYAEKSFETAQNQNNYDEMVNSALRLAELKSSNDEKAALKLYEDACIYAERSHDAYCSITALINLGDFYFNHHKNLSALEKYLQAFKAGKESFYDEIKLLLEEKMSSVKSVLNSDVYYSKIKEYGYED